MPNLHGYMAGDHKDCDEAFVAVESAVAGGDWPSAGVTWRRFVSQLARHFAREEDVLFPEIERATGMSDGPTAVMRSEHEQMRSLLPGLAAHLNSADQSGFLGIAETMLVLIQQHNMKEEQVLYPMAEQILDDAAGVVAAMLAHPDSARG